MQKMRENLILNHVQWILTRRTERDILGCKTESYGEQKFENFSFGWVMAGDVNFLSPCQKLEVVSQEQNFIPHSFIITSNEILYDAAFLVPGILLLVCPKIFLIPLDTIVLEKYRYNYPYYHRRIACTECKNLYW